MLKRLVRLNNRQRHVAAEFGQDSLSACMIVPALLVEGPEKLMSGRPAVIDAHASLLPAARLQHSPSLREGIKVWATPRIRTHLLESDQVVAACLLQGRPKPLHDV